MNHRLDDLDLRLLKLAIEQPRAGVREYARTLQVARGTVQARLDKLQRLGALAGWVADISPTGLGFSTLAYVRLQLTQGVLEDVTKSLAAVPEVLEADSIAGESDLVCKVVAAGPENLEEVVQRILCIPGVMRSRTETVLRRRIPHRVHPLVSAMMTAHSTQSPAPTAPHPARSDTGMSPGKSPR